MPPGFFGTLGDIVTEPISQAGDAVGAIVGPISHASKTIVSPVAKTVTQSRFLRLLQCPASHVR